MYPNEHSARQRDPGEFDPDSFRRKQIAPGISLVMGHMKGGTGQMTVQSVRFDAATHTPDLAKAWLEAHDFKVDSFVAASVEKKSTDGLMGFLGGSVKALGNGKIGGYLITFGGPQDADLTNKRDFFTPKTDFAVKSWPCATDVYYHHGLDEKLGVRRLSDDGSIKQADEVGLWFESQMKMRDDWEKHVYRLAEEGKLSLSSGTLNHLVRREEVKIGGNFAANEVKYWPLGKDATVTPTPADWRNHVYAVKSVSVPSLCELAGVREDRSSLAERTEQLTDRGIELAAFSSDIAVGYRNISEANVKIGQKQLSAARRERLASAHAALGTAHAAIGDILSESVGSDAPGTGSASIPVQAGGLNLEDEMARIRLKSKAMSMARER